MIVEERAGKDTAKMPRTVVIAGVGLIGGSIGQRLRRDGLVETVVGMGRTRENLEKARKLQAIDEIATDWPTAMQAADAVIFCGPVSTIADSAIEAWQHRRGEDVWMSDAGSTKAAIMKSVTAHPGLAGAFVGGHPIAGSERSGVEAARPGMFQGRVTILTPSPATREEVTATASEFWRRLGARVMVADPVSHDRILASTSHLPHVIASALARAVAVENHIAAAGAFRDMTRIAGAEGKMWADIFLANRDFVDESLERHLQEVLEFRTILASGSAEALVDWWSEGQRRRAAFELANPQTPTEARFDR